MQPREMVMKEKNYGRLGLLASPHSPEKADFLGPNNVLSSGISYFVEL